MKGYNMNRFSFIFLAFMIGGTVHATTWAPSEKTDPLTGDKVAARKIMSYGSYIYKWPSKYDLVFWPLTDENWICLNPKNGYAAFNNHFEDISDEEKKTIKQWLEKHYNPAQVPKFHKEKLAWLEKIYQQRKMDDDFWCLFYRLLVYVHRDDHEKSLVYVNKVIPLLKKKLETKPQGIEKIEVLFLLGEYYRRLGELEKAKEYFDQVKKTKYKDEEGEEQVGHPYFIDLIQNRENLKKEESSNN
jgi:tetratricopeptide (TPR) repeat protein